MSDGGHLSELDTALLRNGTGELTCVQRYYWQDALLRVH